LIRRARELNAEYFLIINPDTILDERAVSELIRILDSGNHLASVSPKILTWKSDKIDTLGLILKPGLRFFDYGQGQSELEIKPNIKLEPNIIGPSGAAGLFRMSALDRIRVDNQYFDERMFMYKEDCDLAYRLFLAGYKSQLVSSALIYHDRSVHVGRPGLLGILKNRRTKSRSIRAWSFANQNLLWKKHWRRQNLKNKIIIFSLYLASHIWAILFERFLFNNSKK
ncbi:MAG: hypothetical protein NTX66_03120, partial [Candidatus Falkowbacteria bacterium]|nr:hypothetical protein [Candidatus Falkowbacteria bacterium]